ncbi:MAG: hypothetical protein WCA06_21565, partial [Terrimicrobiaceae bacterium]
RRGPGALSRWCACPHSDVPYEPGEPTIGTLLGGIFIAISPISSIFHSLRMKTWVAWKKVFCARRAVRRLG